MRLAIVADERAAALAGLAGAMAAPGAGRPDADVVIRLGAPPAGPDPVEPDAVWLPGPAPAATSAVRVIATGGGLWSRRPWPARDELFDLPPAPDRRVLVVCDDDERRASALAKLESRGLRAAGAAELDAGDLASASAVALLSCNHAMPAEAPAVLAARRILIAPRCDTTFGLLAGTDHLAFDTEDDVVQYADAVLTFPESFEPFRVLGAVAAEGHRASVVYERLAAELAA